MQSEDDASRATPPTVRELFSAGVGDIPLHRSAFLHFE
jgi:ABC-type long-subunit fatty acid transport system fused permease/ATPase subunit